MCLRKARQCSNVQFWLCAYAQLMRQYVEAEHLDKKKAPFDFTGWKGTGLNALMEEACVCVCKYVCVAHDVCRLRRERRPIATSSTPRGLVC